ncbi:hypothetical protein EA58_19530 [Photobacterium galatheae]|uniref:Uncharacterized protein n=1 Tax=Photobacterium galatheae TaxID=1654360 RepID=A0A066RR31_9GAMM|nr:hypothetical protein EA58_19530 [Photobacterium galatheae]
MVLLPTVLEVEVVFATGRCILHAKSYFAEKHRVLKSEFSGCKKSRQKSGELQAGDVKLADAISDKQANHLGHGLFV